MSAPAGPTQPPPAADPLDTVLARLGDLDCRPRVEGPQWRAICPAHEDRTASLTVKWDPHRRAVLLHCHAGCASDDVAECMGLQLRDLFGDPPSRAAAEQRGATPRPARPRRPATPPRQARPRQPACLGQHDEHAYAPVGARPDRPAPGHVWHPYATPDGTVLAWRVRRVCTRDGCTGRDFAWRQPGPDGKARQGRPDDLPLYRSPELAAALAAGGPVTVHVCEGESDTDAVRAAGAVAVTSGPAGSWKDRHTAQLAGAAGAIVWADRDQGADQGAGIRHARAVTAALTAAGIPAHIVQSHEGKDARDHLNAGHKLGDATPYLEDTMTTPAAPGGTTPGAAGPAQPPAPGSRDDGRALLTPGPGGVIPMSRGQWTWADGTSPEHPRGVWYRPGGSGPWDRVAPLPYVIARVPVRGSDGRPTRECDYVLAASPDGSGGQVTIGPDHLRDGSWAALLGLVLTADDKVVRAAATAIRDMAQLAPEREAALTVSETGHLVVPLPETMPGRYLEGAECGRTVALEMWAEAARSGQLTGESGRLAAMLGASVFGPYVWPLDLDSHIVDAHGGPGQGKTTGLRAAGALWGDARRSRGVVGTFNATGLGLTRHLGRLRSLPAFADEAGAAGAGDTPASRGELIYRLTEGTDRLVAESRGGRGTITSEPWRGVFFRSGNGSVLDGLGAGRWSGTARRVITVESPVTVSAEHAEALAVLTSEAYGHVGPAVLEQVTCEQARAAYAQVSAWLPLPEGPSRAVVKLLHQHVAGAALLDSVLGTGTVLQAAALSWAAEYARGWAPPEHDADRIMGSVLGRIDAEPSAWPTLSEYREHLLPRPSYGETGREELAQHGVARIIAGWLADDASWVAVRPSTWTECCESEGVDSATALRELDRRGTLTRTESNRRAGDYQTLVKGIGRTGGPGRAYRLHLTPPPADPTTAPLTLPEAPAGPDYGSGNGSGNGSVTGPVTGVAEPLTSAVTGVTGSQTEDPRIRGGSGACRVCGERLDPVLISEGSDTHPGCDPTPVTVAQSDTPAESCRRCRGRAAAGDDGLCQPCRALAEAEAAYDRGDWRPTPADHAARTARTGPQRGPAAPGPREATPAGRGAQRGTGGRSGALRERRAEALAAGLAAVDSGQAPKLLDALAGPYAPRSRAGGPYWGPPVPAAAEAALIVSGWAWSRKYDGPTITLDRAGAHLSAAAAVRVGLGSLTDPGPVVLPERGDLAAGYYRVEVQPWTEAGLPSPLGLAQVGSQVWVPEPTATLLRDLARAGRWGAGPLEVQEARTAETSVRLNSGGWVSDYVRPIREHALSTYGQDSPEYDRVKVAYSQAVVMPLGDGAPGQARQWKTKVRRPDWTHAVQSHSAATLWRRADAALRITGPGLGPVALRATDEIVIPTEAGPLVTDPALAGAKGVKALQVEDTGALGTFRIKDTSEGGEDR